MTGDYRAGPWRDKVAVQTQALAEMLRAPAANAAAAASRAGRAGSAALSRDCVGQMAMLIAPFRRQSRRGHVHGFQGSNDMRATVIFRMTGQIWHA